MATIAMDILDALPDPVILIDRSRQVVGANRSAFEFLDGDPVGHDLARSLRHPHVLEAVDAVFGGVPTSDTEISLPGAVPRNVSVHVHGLSAEGGSDDVRAVLVLRDLTLVKRVEEMRADFVANASHELRAPLSALLGFIETIKGPASDDPPARARFLEIMHREAKRMARLIDDLLSLSRVEINEHVRPRDAVNVATLLESVSESLAIRAREREMEIRLQRAPNLPDVVGDGDQLEQVFRNLVENAINYGRPGSPVEVRADAVEHIPDLGGTGVAVTVRDEGEGIPREHIPRLTERFYRVDKARSQSLGGTGLGLAIVKHIVSRHRGRLAIESQAGQGSSFTVYLPATRRVGED